MIRTLLSHLFDDALLARSFAGATIEQWLLLVGAFLATALLMAGAQRLIRWHVARYDDRDRTQAGAVVLDVLTRTRGYFLLALSLYLAARLVGWDARGQAWTTSVLIIASVLQMGRWATGLISLWIRRYQRKNVSVDAASVTSMQAIGLIGRITVWVVVGLTLLAHLGVDVTALVAGLGIGGIAIGLALQNILGDLFASLSIVLDKPFVIGDMLTVGEVTGSVEHIGLKSTRLRSLSGEQVVFSNGDLLSSRVRNFQRMTQRRVVLAVGVTYSTAHETLSRIPDLMRTAVEAQQQTLFERAHFKAFGPSSLDFECVYYVLTADYHAYMDVQQGVGLALFARFEGEGIEFAFPTQTLHLAPPPEPDGRHAQATPCATVHNPNNGQLPTASPPPTSAFVSPGAPFSAGGA